MELIFCKQCGWIGEFKDLKNAMGFDLMCPNCGTFSEDITEYIPSILTILIKKVLWKIGKFIYKLNKARYNGYINFIRTMKI